QQLADFDLCNAMREPDQDEMEHAATELRQALREDGYRDYVPQDLLNCASAAPMALRTRFSLTRVDVTNCCAISETRYSWSCEKISVMALGTGTPAGARSISVV